MEAGDLDAQRLGLEAEALAGGAGDVGEILLQLLARPVALGLLVAALQVGDDALERLLGLVAPHAVVVGEADLVLAGAVQDRLLGLLRQVLPLGVEGEAVVLGEAFDGLQVVRRRRLGPRRDGALLHGGVLVGDDEILVDLLLDAEAAALRAGAERIVEREQPGLDLGDGEAGHRAGELFREDDALGVLVPPGVGLGALELAVGELDHRHALGELEALLQRVGKAGLDVGADHQAVDHHVDVVGELLVERLDLADLVEGAVDLDALVALLEELAELLAVLALAAAHDGGQHVDAGALRQSQHAVDHLRHGLAFDRQAGGRRVRHADARPEQPHVVVDLGDGADRRARVLRGGLLLDGDGRRQAVDLVDVRLLHHLQELPGVGRQRLDVAALPFGVDGVERERGFARAGQAGEHHELVARKLDVDVLEVVLARAANGQHAAVHRVLGGSGAGAGAPAFFKQVVHGIPKRWRVKVARCGPSLSERSKNRSVSPVLDGCSDCV